MKFKINFNQPKYVIGMIAYIGILLIGGLVFWMFDTDIKDPQDANLETTDYLNSNMPKANINGDIKGKREAVQDVFGNVSDYSGVRNIQDDRDSVNAKEGFDTKYTERELKMIEEQNKQTAEIEQLKKMNARLQKESKQKRDISGNSRLSESDFQLPLSASDRVRLNQMRRNGQLSDLNNDLGQTRQSGTDAMAIMAKSAKQEAISDSAALRSKQTVRGADDSKEPTEVVKKIETTNQHFNTIGKNKKQSNMITAIVDEEVKAVDGSRVRIRILDDIMIGDVTVKKGTYMYATMSGFSQQRVQGTIKSVMVGDEIHKINLSIYDTDGLEGLYVPESTFRETSKDVASSAMSSNMNINSGTSVDNSVTQWAMQGIQNAYQKTSNAIAKAIKKNKVRIKYGTRVYLINTKEKKANGGSNGKR